MGTTERHLLAIAWLGLASCASTTYVSVDRLLGDVHRDEAATTQKLAEGDVSLQGKVQRTGQTTRDAIGGPLDGIDRDGGDVRYVSLHGTTSQPGEVLCLFEGRARDAASQLGTGELVTIGCVFRDVIGAPGGRVPVFEGCYVE